MVRSAKPGSDASETCSPFVDDAAVDLVRQHDHVVAQHQLPDPLDIGAGEDPAGRVGRRVEDEQPRPWRDQLLELVEVDPEVVLLADRQADRRAAAEARHRLVDREARVREDDLDARLDQRFDRVEHDRLGARRDDHAVRRGGEALAGGGIRGDRLAQRGQPERRPVVGPAVVERPLRRFADVGRRVEIGLADLEVDDAPTGGLERPGAGRGLEGGLGADRRHAPGELHGPYGSIERIANATFAGRSARRRMYHGYHASP